MLRCKLFNILPNLIFYTHLGTSAQVSERAYEPLDSGIHVLVLCRDNFSWSCSVILNRFFSFKLLSLHEHRHWFAPNKSSTCHIPSKLVCSMHNFHWCSYLDISINCMIYKNFKDFGGSLILYWTLSPQCLQDNNYFIF